MNEGTKSPDVDLMPRCISLAKSLINAGEYPFCSRYRAQWLILLRSIGKVRRNHDVNRHAEIAAISKAQAVRGANLSDCTIYSTVEPRAQCSYAIQEAQIGRVVCMA